MRRTVLASSIAIACASVAACHFDWSLDSRDAGPNAEGGPTDDADTKTDASTGKDGSVCVGALFCSTFEEPLLVPPWDETHLSSSSGALRIEAVAGAPSLPNVLLSRTPASSTSGNAYVTKVITRSIRNAKLSWKVFPGRLDANNRACLGGIAFADGSNNEHLVRILASASGTTVQTKTPQLNAFPISPGLPLNRWSDVSITIEAPGNVNVKIDGSTVLDKPVDTAWPVSTATRIFVGINFVEVPATEVLVRTDDVRFEAN